MFVFVVSHADFGDGRFLRAGFGIGVVTALWTLWDKKATVPATGNREREKKPVIKLSTTSIFLFFRELNRRLQPPPARTVDGIPGILTVVVPIGPTVTKRVLAGDPASAWCRAYHTRVEYRYAHVCNSRRA